MFSLGQIARTTLARMSRSRGIATTANCWEIFNVQSPEEFETRVKQSKEPVVVDFFATWCNPCKMLTPRIETVIGEKAGTIKLAKVDIDEQTDLALDYDVSAVPVLLIMKDGKVQNRMIGLQDTDKIRAFIDQAVDSKTKK